jgi:hypothetical protein
MNSLRPIFIRSTTPDPHSPVFPKKPPESRKSTGSGLKYNKQASARRVHKRIKIGLKELFYAKKLAGVIT